MTDIQLYNTRTRRKEPFRPLIPGKVRMYVCGPTVYDRAHIGNARPVVVFDVLYRLLRHVYGAEAVTYVRNFTDVDDKIIDRARATKREGETLEAACRRITGETIGWYHEDMDALGALRPTHEPRCTEFIPEMVAMIERLIGEGCAYAAEGHVLFDVTKYPRYGQLSRRSLEDMQAGARVEVAPYKRNPMDFVLWKPSTPEQPGWESPWGRGRPGWHIECSAMAQALLGQTFDIHGGGIDLMFPHHENEVAQSCCANHTEVMANFWMHNGFLQVEGEKMAKSLGNFFTVRDLLDKGLQGYEIRMALLMTSYGDPLDWTEKRINEARVKVKRWRRAIDAVPELSREYYLDTVDHTSIHALIADDLNTPAAIEATDKCARMVLDPTFPAELRSSAAELFEKALEVLGFDAMEGGKDGAVAGMLEKMSRESRQRLEERAAMISSLIQLLKTAREKKDWAKSDAIKDALVRNGVKVMIGRDAVSWELDYGPNAPRFDYDELRAILEATQ